ncbi:MAG: hypothetical protein WC802_01320 [Patescibacteria group bacterium]|jgi:hypothetical protein
MKKAYTNNLVPNPLTVLRKAGYSPFRDPQTGDESFIIRLTSEFYPRFHLYVEHSGSSVSFNLHLDQKKPSYGEGHAHGGEYEGSTIEREMGRIDGWVRAGHRTLDTEHQEYHAKPVKQSWISKLFN